MATTMRRRWTAIVGAALVALLAGGISSPVGAVDFEQLEDCFGQPMYVGSAIVVPENSSGWTNGTSGDDLIIGTDGPELINGGGGDDTICAGRGDDWIVGNAGDDMIKGEGGADTIYGNDGDDFILGDAGADEIYGGDHEDTLYGERGDDEMYGEDDVDALIDTGGDDEFDCGSERDTASFDDDAARVSNCETLIEDTGPTEDGD